MQVTDNILHRTRSIVRPGCVKLVRKIMEDRASRQTTHINQLGYGAYVPDGHSKKGLGLEVGHDESGRQRETYV